MKRSSLQLVVCTLGVWLLVASDGYAADDDFYSKQRVAMNFNEAMNRCLASGCKNVAEVLSYFTDTAVYVDASGDTWRGKAAIQKQLQATLSTPGLSDHIEGIDVSGLAITLRLERRKVMSSPSSKSKWGAIAQVNPHIQIIVLDGTKIAKLVSVIPPDEK
jgi:hypothetical protein